MQGNLVIFELKRGNADTSAVEQIMKYATLFGRSSYAQLNDKYKKYKNDNNVELQTEHASEFELSVPLNKEAFNRKQKLVIVGNSADKELIDSIDYWKTQGVDIDFIPYRFYKIDNEYYFELFAKPYDYHLNPRDKKGILFNTNLTYSSENERCMLERKHVEAYGNRKWAVDSFAKGDYVIFYSNGRGVIVIGEIRSSEAKELQAQDAPDGGRYHEVRMIVPENVAEPNEHSKSIPAYELKGLLSQSFWFANINIAPYLSEELRKKYNV